MEFNLNSRVKTYNFVEFNRMNKSITKELGRTQSNSVLFTSGGEGEGKTFIGVNLALNIIENTPQRVLLVDMNLRNPQIHKIFNLPKDNGVTDIINNKVHYAETLKSTKFDNLKVITAGTYGGISAQSFADLRFLIEELKQPFDVTIFESSPILVSNKGNIDPAILSSLIDIVLLVVLTRRTRKISVLRSDELIRLSGGNIYGVVLNDKFVPQKKKKKTMMPKK